MGPDPQSAAIPAKTASEKVATATPEGEPDALLINPEYAEFTDESSEEVRPA